MIEEYHEHAELKGIWHERATNKWFFEDETQNFSKPYNTADEAYEAAQAYAQWLNGEGSSY